MVGQRKARKTSKMDREFETIWCSGGITGIQELLEADVRGGGRHAFMGIEGREEERYGKIIRI